MTLSYRSPSPSIEIILIRRREIGASYLLEVLGFCRTSLFHESDMNTGSSISWSPSPPQLPQQRSERTEFSRRLRCSCVSVNLHRRPWNEDVIPTVTLSVIHDPEREEFGFQRMKNYSYWTFDVTFVVRILFNMRISDILTFAHVKFVWVTFTFTSVIFKHFTFTWVKIVVRVLQTHRVWRYKHLLQNPRIRNLIQSSR